MLTKAVLSQSQLSDVRLDGCGFPRGVYGGLWGALPCGCGGVVGGGAQSSPSQETQTQAEGDQGRVVTAVYTL